MRFDSAGPRTWLLAGTAFWAILALVLGLLGMGRQVEPLPEDPSLVRALPAVPKPVPERLGPITQYAEIANRPLFAKDRQPHPFSLQPEGAEESQAKAFDYKLTSVLITPNLKMAIIKAPDGNTAPLRVKVGEPHEQLPGWQLQSVSPRSAVFVGPEGERTLELAVFDGVGGEAPTMAVAPPPAPVPGDVTAEPQPPAPAPPIADATAPTPDPNSSRPQQQPQQQQTEQAQMDAIRKRIEARRAQLRQEALQEQQQLRRQNQKPPVK